MSTLFQKSFYTVVSALICTLTFLSYPAAADAPVTTTVVLKGLWEHTVYVPPLLSMNNIDEARPLVYGGRVFTGSGAGKVCAFDLDSGKTLWCAKPTNGKPIYARPLVIGHAIFIGGYDGCIHRLDLATGHELPGKPFCTDGLINSDLSGTGDLVFFTTNTGKAYAIRAKDLSFVWQHQVNRPMQFRIHARSGVLVHGQDCYVGYYTGRIQALDCNSGNVKWSASLATSEGLFQDVLFTPALVKGMLIISGYKAGLAAMNPANGALLWHVALSAPSAVANFNGRILVTTGNRELVEVSTAGKVLKRVKMHMDACGTPIVTSDGVILLPMDKGMAVIGQDLQLQAVYVIRSGLGTQPAVFANKLFFMDNRGVFNCVEVLQP